MRTWKNSIGLANTEPIGRDAKLEMRACAPLLPNKKLGHARTPIYGMKRVGILMMNNLILWKMHQKILWGLHFLWRIIVFKL